MVFYNSSKVNSLPLKTTKLKSIKLVTFLEPRKAMLSDNLVSSKTDDEKKCFWNQTFDKGRLKNFVLWFLRKHGEHKTVQLVEELKTVGFKYATKAGISLGIEDLKIPKKKHSLIMEAEQLSISTVKQYKRGEITGVERFQRLIDTWHRTSETLKQEVIDNFEATDILNPVYMMAFSGARGNVSQVRQLVGMRGLMSDPQGKIIDFPIRSNFREGLTLTEYIISSYGARKGIVDTALRTANAGYLTRRLVDVAQHVIISNFDCGTKRGIFLNDMKEGNKTIYSLQNRLVGRVLARDIYNKKKIKIASRNVEVSIDLANTISANCKKAFVRSSLTCQTKKLVCQLCYGWSLAQGNLVSIGEAVGVVAAQSIGEPGTQLTMRTFHTGGVFAGDVSDQIRAPFNGVVEYDNPIAGTLIRTPEGKIAFLTKNEGSFTVHSLPSSNDKNLESKRFKIPFYTLLFLKNGSTTTEKEVIAQISSINRQKNATDQVELTIKSELSGQFYSKILDLKENKVGPKLKTSGLLKSKAKNLNLSSSLDKNSSLKLENISDSFFSKEEQFNENAIDTVFESWGWGYAWVLSGQIYQLTLPSPFFPIIGDYVNKKTYMNQINWNIASTFGTSFHLNMPLKKKILNKKIIKQMRSSFMNSNLLSQNDLILLKTELVSFKLSKIVYKKIGYLLKLTEPSVNFTFSKNNFKNYFKSSFDKIQTKEQQLAMISSNDPLFLLSSMFSNEGKNVSDSYSKGEDFVNSSLQNKKKINSVYPANWKPSFNVFLNWFPKRLATKTGGLIFIEPLFFGNQLILPIKAISQTPKISSKISLLGKKTKLSSKYFKNKKRTLRSLPIDFENYNKKNLRKEFLSSLDKNKKNIQPKQFRFVEHLENNNLNGSEKLVLKNYPKCDFFSSVLKKDVFLQKANADVSNIPFFPTFVRRDSLINLSVKDSLRGSGLFSSLSSLPSLPGNTSVLNPKVEKEQEQKEGREQKEDGPNIFEEITKEKGFYLPSVKENTHSLKNNYFLGFHTLENKDYSPKNNVAFFQNTAELSKSLIFEQYQPKNFGTILQTVRNSTKNKTKTELLTFGLMWKNCFKLNNNILECDLESFNSFPKKTCSSKGSLPKRENQSHLNLRRIFWVSQPFFNISLKNAKTTFLNLKQKSQMNQPILFQTNRQGQVKSLSVFPKGSLPEGHIQTTQNKWLMNSIVEKKNTPFHFSNLTKQIINTKEANQPLIKKKFKTNSVIVINPANSENIVFNKQGMYFFRSFNTNLVKHLKKRQKTIHSFLPSKQNLKSFSKISSFPYFLDKKTTISLKKFFLVTNKSSFLPSKTKTSFKNYSVNKIKTNLNRSSSLDKKQLKIKNGLSLFNFYFYSLANKKIKMNTFFSKKIDSKRNYSLNFSNLKKIQTVKQICSPYLNDQLPYSLVALQNNSVDKLVLPQKNHQLNNKKIMTFCDLGLKRFQFSIFYNHEQNHYYYGLKTNVVIKPNRLQINNGQINEIKNNPLNLSFFEMPSRKISFERILQLENWLNQSKFYKKINLKKLFETINKIDKNLLETNPQHKKLSVNQLMQKVQIQRLLKMPLSLKKESFSFSKPLSSSKSLSNNFLLNKNKKIQIQKNLNVFAKKYKTHSHQTNNNSSKKHHTKQKNTLVNLIVKPGWLYYTSNLSNFFLYNKKLINAGKKIGSELIFESHSVYIEIISLQKMVSEKKTNSFLEFPKVGFPLIISHNANNKKNKENTKFNQKNTLKNKKCRFDVECDLYSKVKTLTKVEKDSILEKISTLADTNQLNNPEKFVVLIRKAHEYKLFKEIETKKQISKISNHKNNGPSLFNLNQTIAIGLNPWKDSSNNHNLSLTPIIKDVEGNQEIKITKGGNSIASANAFPTLADANSKLRNLKFINKSFNSINLYSQYKTGLLNKQKISSQTLSKYPSSDFKVISNPSFYSSLSVIQTSKSNSFERINPTSSLFSKKTQNFIKPSANADASQIPQENENEVCGVNRTRTIQLSQSSAWGLSCYFKNDCYNPPITAIKAINLSPLILSYKAPYSLDFPFKTPMHLFTEQYKPNLDNSSMALREKKTSSIINSNLGKIPPLNIKSNSNDFKEILYTYLLKIKSNEAHFKQTQTVNLSSLQSKERINYNVLSSCSLPSVGCELYFSKTRDAKETNALRAAKAMTFLSSLFSCPIVEYSLGEDFEQSIAVPNNLNNSNFTHEFHKKGSLSNLIGKNTSRDLIWNFNNVNNKRILNGLNGPILGSLNGRFESTKKSELNKEIFLYKTEFVSFLNNRVSTQLPFVKTYSYSAFEGELIYKNSKSLNHFKPVEYKSENLVQFNSSKAFKNSNLFEKKSVDNSCMVLTQTDQIAFYFPKNNYKEIYASLENLKLKNQYMINDLVINFLNISEQNVTDQNEFNFPNQTISESLNSSLSNDNFNFNQNDDVIVKINKLPAGMSQQTNKVLLGEFLVYGDQISPKVGISNSGQIIHLNNQKVTLRKGQPLFVSPNAVLHKYDGDFIDEQAPVITLSYQQLKTGDIIQGIPKVEQFFEARTTKRGRLFRDSLANLLKGLFKRYRSKLPLDQAVRQSFYKIQQIIVDGVQRVYRSQGVTIADKHLEVIVKQMTSKVRIIEGGQTGFFPGEIVDLEFVEQVNSLLMKKIIYEPLVLGITKSSLEVDSFLSAASFQQTTKVLSKAAIFRKKDFLKGLKENVILGNLIPAGTGYLVYLDQL